jgi:GTP-dependent phosphoenolpyruvate carboxykinase
MRGSVRQNGEIGFTALITEIEDDDDHVVIHAQKPEGEVVFGNVALTPEEWNVRTRIPKSMMNGHTLSSLQFWKGERMRIDGHMADEGLMIATQLPVFTSRPTPDQFIIQ